jgi:transcriptional regulator with XRE-family HTH domain
VEQQQQLSLGTKIRHLRGEAMMTQQKLAGLANCSTSYISRLESNEVMPTVGMLTNIAGVFGKTVDTLTAPETRDTSERIWEEIKTERRAQDYKHGGPDNDDQHNGYIWITIFTDHLGELSKALWNRNLPKFRYQLVRLAAIAVAAIEWCDRKGASKNE